VSVVILLISGWMAEKPEFAITVILGQTGHGLVSVPLASVVSLAVRSSHENVHHRKG
jgi:hypothetical protein